MGSRRTGKGERTAGPGRAGGGLNVVPLPFDVREAQILASALRDFPRAMAWAEAFLAVVPLVREEMARPERPIRQAQ